jgi:hypothetical protein
MFDDIVRESICKYFARKRWDRHSGRLSLEDIAEMLEITISTAHRRGFEFECGYVGLES